MKGLNQNSRGDTIVEVLLAMAVAASVLGITYATMNRNLMITRANQERTEASKIAQGQLEALRDMPTGTIPAASTPFCINGGIKYTASSVPKADLATDNFTAYGTNCTDSFYHYVVVGGGASNPYKYKVYVRWDRVDGNGRDQVIMSYRI